MINENLIKIGNILIDLTQAGVCEAEHIASAITAKDLNIGYYWKENDEWQFSETGAEITGDALTNQIFNVFSEWQLPTIYLYKDNQYVGKLSIDNRDDLNIIDYIELRPDEFDITSVIKTYAILKKYYGADCIDKMTFRLDIRKDR